MAHDVFISYSRRDKATADAVCAALEGRAIRCWIAPRDVLLGMEWGEAVVNAIHEARVMVMVFSSRANESRHMCREVERAVAQGMAIVPLRIEDIVPSSALELFIGGVHWLDALTPPLEQHLSDLTAKTETVLHMMHDRTPGAGGRTSPGGTTRADCPPPAPAASGVSRFCTHCGAARATVLKYCTDCGTRSIPGARSCGRCGARNAGVSTFCTSCGARL